MRFPTPQFNDPVASSILSSLRFCRFFVNFFVLDFVRLKALHNYFPVRQRSTDSRRRTRREKSCPHLPNCTVIRRATAVFASNILWCVTESFPLDDMMIANDWDQAAFSLTTFSVYFVAFILHLSSTMCRCDVERWADVGARFLWMKIWPRESANAKTSLHFVYVFFALPKLFFGFSNNFSMCASYSSESDFRTWVAHVPAWKRWNERKATKLLTNVRNFEHFIQCKC